MNATNSSSQESLFGPDGCPLPPEKFPDWIRALGFGLFVFTSVYLPVTIILFAVRRYYSFELQKRNFRLMVVSAVGVYFNVFTASWVNWAGAENFPCHAHAVMVFMVLPLAAGPVIVRLILFYNKHRYAEMLLQENKKKRKMMRLTKLGHRQSFLAELGSLFRFACCGGKDPERVRSSSGESNDSVELESGEFEDDKSSVGGRSHSALVALHFMSSKFSFSFVVLLGFLALGLVTIVMQYTPADSPYAKGCSACFLEAGDIIYFGSTLIIIILFCGYFLCKVRNVEDPLGIKQELKYTLAIGLFAVAAVGMALGDPGNLRDKRQFDWMYLVNIACLLFHTVQCVWPVLRSYERQKDAEEGTTLANVLSNTAQRLQFAKYLAVEFSIENLWFYDAVLQYKLYHSKLSSAKKTELADEIYQTFVKDGGLMEVNLDSSTKRKVSDTLQACGKSAEEPPVNLFDAAQLLIFKLMEEDSFPRFLRSKYFKHAPVQVISTKSLPPIVTPDSDNSDN